MKLRLVLIGSDEFRVDSKGSQDAKFRASELFRDKYSLDCSLSKIAGFAFPVPLPTSELSTNLVLKILRGELQEVEEVVA